MSHSASLKTKRTVGRALNASIVVMLLVLSGIGLKNYYRDGSNSPTIGPSARISIKGVDLTRSPQTLLLAVAKDCEYCTDSSRFYRRLVQGLAGRSDIRVVFIFPDTPAEGRDYLSRLGLTASESTQASLPSLGIERVPTLALLNRDGIVSDVWIGKLPPKKEAEVMRKLAMEDLRPTSDWLIDKKELERRLGKEEMVLVDLRDRAAYAQGHHPGAKNIPFDELYARAGNELPRSSTIVLYSNNDINTDLSYTVLSRQNFPRVLILSREQDGQ